MPARRSPTLQRRRLGVELRRLREDAGLTIERAAERLGFSESKISRIEHGQTSASPRDVEKWLTFYDVSNERRTDLIRIAREARQKGWWQAYGDAEVAPLAGLEAEAERIRAYEALAVPGLFQTSAYAKSIIQAVRPDLSPERMERRVELRIARQSILTERDPPVLRTILDEAVLRRPVGGPVVMGEQLHHLRDIANLPDVTLQVLPFAAGEHAGIGGAFTIFGFHDPTLSDIVCLEYNTDYVYIETAEDRALYSSAFESLSAISLDAQDSFGMLADLIRSYH